METEAALLAAIAAEPDEDTPRLAFADWLDEHAGTEADRARAELIRLQCGPPADDASARAEALLGEHQATWDRALAPFAGEVLYCRGFPHFLKADFARIVAHRELLGHAPDWHLCPTREGHRYGEPETDACVRLATGPFADRIRGLNLAWAGWLEEELDALLVDLSDRLRELRFGDDDRCLETLEVIRWSATPTLETLGFGGDSYGGIGDTGCAVLAGDARFAGLTTLELPNNGLSPAGVLALARSPHIRQLRRLDLAGGSNSTNTIGDEGAAHIAGSANFRHLTELNLLANGVGNAGFLALRRSPHLNALASLNLPMNPLTDAALIAFAESADGLPALRWLNVSNGLRGQITGLAVARLARSHRLERLTGLKLGGQAIGDEGAVALAESPFSRNLRELYVGGCGIGPDGFARLLESPHLAGVRTFATSGNRLTPDDVADLRARFPGRVE